MRDRAQDLEMAEIRLWEEEGKYDIYDVFDMIHDLFLMCLM